MNEFKTLSTLIREHLVSLIESHTVLPSVGHLRVNIRLLLLD